MCESDNARFLEFPKDQTEISEQNVFVPENDESCSIENVVKHEFSETGGSYESSIEVPPLAQDSLKDDVNFNVETSNDSGVTSTITYTGPSITHYVNPTYDSDLDNIALDTQDSQQVFLTSEIHSTDSSLPSLTQTYPNLHSDPTFPTSNHDYSATTENETVNVMSRFEKEQNSSYPPSLQEETEEFASESTLVPENREDWETSTLKGSCLSMDNKIVLESTLEEDYRKEGLMGQECDSASYSYLHSDHEYSESPALKESKLHSDNTGVDEDRAKEIFEDGPHVTVASYECLHSENTNTFTQNYGQEIFKQDFPVTNSFQQHIEAVDQDTTASQSVQLEQERIAEQLVTESLLQAKREMGQNIDEEAALDQLAEELTMDALYYALEECGKRDISDQCDDDDDDFDKSSSGESSSDELPSPSAMNSKTDKSLVCDDNSFNNMEDTSKQYFDTTYDNLWQRAESNSKKNSPQSMLLMEEELDKIFAKDSPEDSHQTIHASIEKTFQANSPALVCDSEPRAEFDSLSCSGELAQQYGSNVTTSVASLTSNVEVGYSVENQCAEQELYSLKSDLQSSSNSPAYNDCSTEFHENNGQSSQLLKQSSPLTPTAPEETLVLHHTSNILIQDNVELPNNDSTENQVFTDTRSREVHIHSQELQETLYEHEQENTSSPHETFKSQSIMEEDALETHNFQPYSSSSFEQAPIILNDVQRELGELKLLQESKKHSSNPFEDYVESEGSGTEDASVDWYGNPMRNEHNPALSRKSSELTEFAESNAIQLDRALNYEENNSDLSSTSSSENNCSEKREFGKIDRADDGECSTEDEKEFYDEETCRPDLEADEEDNCKAMFLESEALDDDSELTAGHSLIYYDSECRNLNLEQRTGEDPEYQFPTSIQTSRIQEDGGDFEPSNILDVVQGSLGHDQSMIEMFGEATNAYGFATNKNDQTSDYIELDNQSYMSLSSTHPVNSATDSLVVTSSTEMVVHSARDSRFELDLDGDLEHYNDDYCSDESCLSSSHHSHSSSSSIENEFNSFAERRASVKDENIQSSFDVIIQEKPDFVVGEDNTVNQAAFVPKPMDVGPPRPLSPLPPHFRENLNKNEDYFESKTRDEYSLSFNETFLPENKDNGGDFLVVHQEALTESFKNVEYGNRSIRSWSTEEEASCKVPGIEQSLSSDFDSTPAAHKLLGVEETHESSTITYYEQSEQSSQFLTSHLSHISHEQAESRESENLYDNVQFDALKESTYESSNNQLAVTPESLKLHFAQCIDLNTVLEAVPVEQSQETKPEILIRQELSGIEKESDRIRRSSGTSSPVAKSRIPVAHSQTLPRSSGMKNRQKLLSESGVTGRLAMSYKNRSHEDISSKRKSPTLKKQSKIPVRRSISQPVSCKGKAKKKKTSGTIPANTREKKKKSPDISRSSSGESVNSKKGQTSSPSNTRLWFASSSEASHSSGGEKYIELRNGVYTYKSSPEEEIKTRQHRYKRRAGSPDSSCASGYSSKRESVASVVFSPEESESLSEFVSSPAKKNFQSINPPYALSLDLNSSNKQTGSRYCSPPVGDKLIPVKSPIKNLNPAEVPIERQTEELQAISLVSSGGVEEVLEFTSTMPLAQNFQHSHKFTVNTDHFLSEGLGLELTEAGSDPGFEGDKGTGNVNKILSTTSWESSSHTSESSSITIEKHATRIVPILKDEPCVGDNMLHSSARPVIEQSWPMEDGTQDESADNQELRLHAISSQLGTQWMELAKELGVSEDDVWQVEKECSEGEPGEKSFCMLLLWLEKSRRNEDTDLQLKEGLEKIGRPDLAEKLDRKVNYGPLDQSSNLDKQFLYDSSCFNTLADELGSPQMLAHVSSPYPFQSPSKIAPSPLVTGGQKPETSEKEPAPLYSMHTDDEDDPDKPHFVYVETGDHPSSVKHEADDVFVSSKHTDENDIADLDSDLLESVLKEKLKELDTKDATAPSETIQQTTVVSETSGVVTNGNGLDDGITTQTNTVDIEQETVVTQKQNNEENTSSSSSSSSSGEE